ncbi:ATP/maltotriose-dependent transcriptional regulator MalT [Nocardiopsis mwathae]|uniref:ATP/maltotriose-dependent transcriptional regulator MalT n=1 Tax=Nocardiopsis mwathae TaxID=1472723 RepID=A0A7X0D5U9_9ACTN|nr:LuxR family transcriptional regulator [Nocardiopsis mwathae]MBB6172595.1 ATP/maltotriose-dependent transcriptional regulator MalT [Nocardiopsis mwathae]
MSTIGTSPVFVGRRAELRALLDHAHRARTEAPATMLIGGDAGVGKSRLVTEFATRAGQGRVVFGGCLELGVSGLPFAPFAAVLRHLLRDLGRAPFDALALDGEHELARLLPELGRAPTERREARGILFEQVLRLLTAAARPDGLTVVVEDLHWADNATRDLLIFLLRNLDTAGIQVVATFRSDDLHRTHPLRRLLPELERLTSVTRMDLRPLDHDEVAEQAAAIRGTPLPPEEVTALFERTGGNPLFVESLTDCSAILTGDVPESTRELLLASLHRLDDRARFVVRVASVGAVSGGRIEHGLLAHVADLPEDTLDAALHAVVDTNLLRVEGTGYRFRHALLREAVHSELLPGQHARLHLRFAEALDTLPGAAPADRLAAEQAHHFHAAGDLPRALSAAWSAGVHARESLAYAEALLMLERVLELWDRVPDAEDRTGGDNRVDVTSLAAGCAVEAGQVQRARELCDLGLGDIPADARDARSLARRGVLLRRRGQARIQLSDSEGLDDFHAAQAVHPRHAYGYGFLLSLLAREALLRQRMPGRTGQADDDGHDAIALATEAIRYSEAPPAGAEDCDDCAKADALITLGTALLGRGETEAGRAALDEGVGMAQRMSEPSLETRGMINLSHHLREQGRHGEAIDVLDRSLERLRDLGLMSSHGPFTALNLAETHFDLGNLETSRQMTRTGLGWSPSPTHRVYLGHATVRAALAMGDLADARAHAAHGDVRRTLTTARIHTAQLGIAATLELDLADNDLDHAIDLAGETLRTVDLGYSSGYGWLLIDLVAEVLRRASADAPQRRPQQTAEVRRLVDEVAAAMPEIGPVQSAYRVSSSARLAAADLRDATEVAATWRNAVDTWECTPLRLRSADARLHAAEAGVAAGDRADADTWVRAAAATAKECGAAVLENRAADLARRLGISLDATAGTAPPALPAGLTPRETEVLRLLGRGYTNAEIAGELFIAVKTASVHVSNILAKLDVANRGAAGARARELGLAG